MKKISHPTFVMFTGARTTSQRSTALEGGDEIT